LIPAESEGWETNKRSAVLVEALVCAIANHIRRFLADHTKQITQL
jgi:hypothetical protein